METEISKAAFGEAGEFFVASQATLRGWTANMQRHNHKGADILISKESSALTVRGLQVKTSQRASQWRMSRKDEGAKHAFCPDFFYVLVVLTEEQTFEIAYIVPAKVVAELIYRGHREYLKRGGKDSDIRQLKASELSQYKDAWHLLG